MDDVMRMSLANAIADAQKVRGFLFHPLYIFTVTRKCMHILTYTNADMHHIPHKTHTHALIHTARTHVHVVSISLHTRLHHDFLADKSQPA